MITVITDPWALDCTDGESEVPPHQAENDSQDLVLDLEDPKVPVPP